MRSPKFTQKLKDIETVINPARLKSRWRKKVRDSMRTKSIPDPVEHLDFHINLDAQCQAICAEVTSGTYIPQPSARFLAEKSKGLCRQLVIPAARDALVLQTLSDALWVELSKKAPSKNAFYAPEDNKFSKGFVSSEQGYGSLSQWLNFQKTILGFTKRHTYIIVTDIANYYDFISYDHLRNIIADNSFTREHSLDLLIYTLSHMLWQPDYMPRIAVGLPQINLDAPRLLAHCFLFEIDLLLSASLKVDFTRFMDDIDVGVDSLATAKRVLRDLDLSLQTRQIRLHSGKTLILKADEAGKHFRIRENAFLDRLEGSIKLKTNNTEDIEREKIFISRCIDFVFVRDTFVGGNGPKILKRLINYARKYQCYISTKAFSIILNNWPSLRQAALLWWQHASFEKDKLDVIARFMISPDIVDDASLIDAAICLVNARLPATLITQLWVEEICWHLNEKDQWSLYAKLWILSKYGTADQLYLCVEKAFSFWVAHEYLTRLVAGLFPRFWNGPFYSRFEGMLQKGGGRWSSTVYDLHKSLATNKLGLTSVEKFLKALNSSLPNKISHSKFLMLCSLSANKNIAPAAIGYLKTTHQEALTDEFYVGMTH